jgi:hypothetical protein
MKKLEDIPKKQIFDVPDGYFENLPGKIQARISGSVPSTERNFVFRYKLQYALPVILFMAIGIYWFAMPAEPKDVESLLASVQTEELVAYLGESDITTEDLLEHVEFNVNDLEEIESEAYAPTMDESSLENVIDNMDLDTI